ncbi:hypothetical protein FKW77_000842 [Venturia effusa]|uniref:MYND-type domain-containing protein n=1 Tax=Venturia effusa TaxID=50376 RepID=A0A517LM33_9PEZI|nr:hypothetical protein FKW77_000842 [Venturia effusa]
MDLLQTVRKEGSRGGRADFKWEDVKNDAQRENYLGHSLMAPVGRWQQGKDLNWYAKGDATKDGEMTAAEKRKEEIRKIKEAEEEARCIALGLPPPNKNSNLVPLGEGKNQIEDHKPKEIEEEERRKRRHRSRSRDRDEKRRHRRHRSSSRDKGRRHRRHRSISWEDEGRRVKRERSESREGGGRRHRRHRSTSAEDDGRKHRRSISRDRFVRPSKDRSRSRGGRRDDSHRRRRDVDDRSRSPYKAARRRNDSSYSPDRRSRYRDDRYISEDLGRKRRSKTSDIGEPNKCKPVSVADLKQAISSKESQIASLLQTHIQKELSLAQTLMDRMNDNEGLRHDLDLSTQVINSLNQQVNDLLDWNWDIEIQQVKRPRTDWGEAESGEYVPAEDHLSKLHDNPPTRTRRRDAPPLALLEAKVLRANVISDLRNQLCNRERDLEAAVKETSDKKYVIERKIMLTEKENHVLRYEVEVSTKVIDALNRQVDLLGDKDRERPCSRCQSASYCSPECQKKDWSLHKILCKKYKAFLSTNQSQRHCIGIYLPEDHSKPRLVWIEVETSTESQEAADVDADADVVIMLKATPKLRPLLGLTNASPEPFMLTTDHDLGSKFQLPYSIQATSRDLKTQTATNECVAALVGVFPASFWKGPVVLTRFFTMNSTRTNGNDGVGPRSSMKIRGGTSIVMGESEQVENMTLADFTHAMGLLEAANVAELEADDGQ